MNDNYNDNFILDDDVEVEYSQRNSQEPRINNYSNQNVNTYNFFERAFSKKFLALTLATISIILSIFTKFLAICGVTSTVLFGIIFFLYATICIISLVSNNLNFAKIKKVELNVSSVITFVALLILVIL